jgi:hypothetical protein
MHVRGHRTSNVPGSEIPGFISVNSRLSVPDRWLFRLSARWKSPSTDGKRLDFEDATFFRAMSVHWFLKCILRARERASNIIASSVDIVRFGLSCRQI